MSYARKLVDPRWQRKRLAIFERDGFACVRCGNDREQLEVHHKRYAESGKPWDVPDSDLVTLCHTCHEHVTKHGWDAPGETPRSETPTFDAASDEVRAIILEMQQFADIRHPTRMRLLEELNRQKAIERAERDAKKGAA